jgi:N-acetylneuraminate synthase
LASKLIEVAASAGANAVKFQTFKTAQLVTRAAPKAEYQTRKTDALESQFEMLKKLELSAHSHRLLLEQCRARDIEFLSTPFDTDSLHFLVDEIGIQRVKIASGEITNGPLLLAASHTGKPIILSTGMSTLDEIETALGVLAFGYTQPEVNPAIPAFRRAFQSPAGQAALRHKITLLHCVTEYPAPLEQANLRAIDTIQKRFGLPVGYSDHTQGIAAACVSVALGAPILEKHFTLDRKLPGPDHAASIEPDELVAMIKLIREAEKSLGDGIKQPMPCEAKNLAIARRSLVAAQRIRKGDLFSEQNLTSMRPGSGIAPMHYWDWIGTAASRNFEPGEMIR